MCNSDDNNPRLGSRILKITLVNISYIICNENHAMLEKSRIKTLTIYSYVNGNLMVS